MLRANTYLTIFIFIMLLSCDNDGGADLSATGQGGSLTRFAIKDNYMYVVDKSSIQVYNIANTNFLHVSTVSIQPGMETAFAKGEYLYIGANDGMYIYSLKNPEYPSFVFRYEHIVSCDPVVVQGNRAYVTLHTESRCNRGSNRLDIINISDPYNPSLIRSYPLTAPQGLAIDKSLLFVCEGEGGLSILDVKDDYVNEVAHLDDFNAYDVILHDGIATITGKDGIFQYAYNVNGSELKLLSKITVNREEL